MHLPMPSSAPSWNIHERRLPVEVAQGGIEVTYPWGSGERPPIVALPSDWTLASPCIGNEDFDKAFTKRGTTITENCKGMCAACPVFEQCKEETMRLEGDAPERMRHGISAGMTPDERFALFAQSGTQPQAGAASAPYALTEALSA